MNQLTIIGNLVRDPEPRTTQSGVTACVFSVAVNRKVNGEDKPDFFRVTAWRQLGENCAKYLSKGRKVCVIGPVSLSTYTGQDGQTRANMDVTAAQVEFLSAKEEQKPGPKPKGEQVFHPVSDEDELPFD